ncbi:hypothetical protein BG003_008334 [Podila horticola]|nr:hypothetical protein BG003_008334 [Podila horticola]
MGLLPRHPARVLLGSCATPALPPGGFPIYTQIPSYPAFIRKVAPELERRLTQSHLVEGSWAKGLEMTLHKGKIQAVHDWTKPSPEEAMKEKTLWKKKSRKEEVPCPQV